MHNIVIHIRLYSRIPYIMFIKLIKKKCFPNDEQWALLCCCIVGQNKQFSLCAHNLRVEL